MNQPVDQLEAKTQRVICEGRLPVLKKMKQNWTDRMILIICKSSLSVFCQF